MVVYLLTAACAIGVVLLASRLAAGRLGRRGTDDGEPGGATAGHAGSMISALFLLAFAVAIVVPWTTADAARLNTYTEAQAITEAYWAAERLPAGPKEHARAALVDYARFVRDEEWPRMAEGRLSPGGWTRLDAVRREIIALPAPEDEIKDARAAFLEQVTAISAARHQRAMDAGTRPPPALLVITAVTGLLVVLFPFLAGARPRGLAALPLALMAGLLAVGVYLAVDISHTFTGGLGVGPDAFGAALEEIKRVSGGS
ncbi:DUF4239 domain-containing protein [Actinomadura viridis]|uniref:DUF4239 domain-containing protein n=1 Tax=Actinomadura viridis TaxID=58110 RepID=A0A931DJL8_9ACTN|nr:DUF4239 domain-containing protein [Actinomadura viridis]MBG6089788.1 hypothetical protein [Actinomadura viridis]